MHKKYHIQITTQALQRHFSAHALENILKANLGQDDIAGQIWHPEYHFDASQFDQGYAYLAEQRLLSMEALINHESLPAWQAFGRLTHAVQDFYAHSNYIRLWLASQANSKDTGIAPEHTDPLDRQILDSPDLISGHIYYPWELISFLPGMATIMRRFLPQDSHTCLNLDSPKQGILFDYALVAACKRTTYEFEGICADLSPDQLQIFCGTSTSPIED